MSVNVMLDTPVIIIPATEAKTTDSFKVIYVEENYGWRIEDNEGRPINRAPGRENSVLAAVVLCEDPYIERRIIVWEGDEYLAVRGSWTDQTMYEKIKQILQRS